MLRFSMRFPIRFPIRFLALSVTLVLFVAACGNGADPSDTTVPPTEEPTTTAPPVPTTTPDTTTAPTTTTPATAAELVTLYFATGDGSDCSEVSPFEREVSAPADPIAAAFDLLVGGPTADEASAGAGSFFSAATLGSVRSVTLEDGLLEVDFEDFRAEIANASTSCGSASLIASLNATAFQFSEVERVRYSVFGSCGAFFNWLQGECQDMTRTGSVAVDLDTNEEASGSGCTPGSAQLPDGEWFGYLTSAGIETIEFDLACWFTGTPAADAAAEDGFESPPPNDYYIRNESSELRTIPVGDDGVIARLLPPTGGPELATVSYEEWAAGWDARDYQPGVWVTISGSEVVEITEQYQP